MEPDYREGDFVLVLRARMWQIKRGTAIAFVHPEYGLLIKKVDHLESQHVWVSGTNSRSVKSQTLGPISMKQILGTVVARFRN
jgi:hypothetical protein